MVLSERIWVYWFGTRLGKALRIGDYDKAVKIMDKSIRVRCRHTGNTYEDAQRSMLECYVDDDDIDFRNMAAIYRQKYCNRDEQPDHEEKEKDIA